MQRHIDLEFEKLRNRIIKMGSLVEEQVAMALKSLVSPDSETVKRIIDIEIKIDNMDIKIDKLCQRIFATTQPVASDLRFIMAALKIDNDLERVGDIAVSIAKKMENINEYPELITKVKLEEFAKQAEKMIKDAIDCFINKDHSLAIEILRFNLFVSEKSQNIFNDILLEMQSNPNIIITATNLILVLRHIERLKDHAANIAEDVVFMIDGKIVKHSKIQDDKNNILEHL
jgi:phosphate transport system protein